MEVRNVNETLVIGGDLTVHRLGFGAMRITGKGIWGHPPDSEKAKELLRHVAASPTNLIDTADSYGPDVSEQLIADALWPYSKELVIATKAGLLRSGPNQWHADGRPQHLRNACEGSLRRLRIEHIDLYQLHRPDPNVPLEESVGALAELKAEGKIRHVGLSNVTVSELGRAQKIVPIVSVQNRYNLEDRDSEDVLEACERQGIAFIPWFPLATGTLAQHGGKLDRIAHRNDAKPSQIALAWLLQRSPVMLPIPGTSSIEHFDENARSVEIRLTDQEFGELKALSG
jgi:aryl-alcohol dehydrogenase-like predicted oxidoreductase